MAGLSASLPSVMITAPSDGIVIQTPSSFDVKVMYAPGSIGSPIIRIEYLLNGTVIGSTVPPVAIFRTPVLQQGTYLLKARVWDAMGNAGDSQDVKVGIFPPVASAPVSVPASSTPVVSCDVPVGIATQADVDKWNRAHPNCPAISLPRQEPSGLTVLMIGAVAVAIIAWGAKLTSWNDLTARGVK